MEDVNCRFCGKPAVAIYSLPKGCFCFPDDHEQALCFQHIISAEPIDEMQLKEVLCDEPTWDWFLDNLQRYPPTDALPVKKSEEKTIS